jgi:ABC-type sulfate transport system substrate-binding protein
MNAFALVALVLSIGLVTFANIHAEKSNPLLNVSYDPTRELFKDARH